MFLSKNFFLNGQGKSLAVASSIFILFVIPVTILASLNFSTNTTHAAGCFDVDHDGVVKSSDIDLLKRQIKENLFVKSSDVNGDGVLNQKDVDLIQGSIGKTCSPQVTFFATPDSVKAGGKIELIWSVDHAQTINIQGLGNVSREGKKSISVTKDTVFRLVATSVGGRVEASSFVSLKAGK